MRESLKIFINELLSKIKIDHLSLNIKKYYLDKYQQIINETHYLPEKCKFTERLYHIINNLYEIPKCKECGKNYTKFLSINRKYREFCTIKCAINNKEVRDKIKQSNLRNFGTEYPIQNIEFQNKMMKNNKEKYGVENVSQIKEVREKKRQIWNNKSKEEKEKIKKKREEFNYKKYGSKCSLQNKEIQIKSRETWNNKSKEKNKEIRNKQIQSRLRNEYIKLFNSNRLKGLIIPLFTIDEYIGEDDKDRKLIYYLFQCIKCNNIFEDNLASGRIPRCHKCFPKKNKFTIPHQIIVKFLIENNINHETEKHIGRYEVDEFIKPNKIIEIYGDYWHANPKKYLAETIMNYPYRKMMAKEKWELDEKRINYLKNKYDVLVIWEDEINNDFENVKNKISILLDKIKKYDII